MRLLISLLLLLIFASCDNKNKADISGIKADLPTQRFERDLFTIDTASLHTKLDQVISRYPSFGENFLTTILNTDPRWSTDTAASYIKGFITAYRPVYDSSQKVFADFSKYEEQIEKGVRYIKYYYPQYKSPQRIITYIGPLDGFGDILSEDAFIVGLHHHLGANFSMYQSSYVNETYPAYISARFQPEYIQVNAMKNIVNDMFPERFEDLSLVNQMIEKGKRLYLLNRFLPDVEEYLLIGYTKKQLKESYEHERAIWQLFMRNNLLQSIDNNIIKNYIGESPKTMELGEASPGNIGSFTGWQIVKKYIAEHPDVTPQKLMQTTPDIIFQEAKYKP